MSGKGKDFHGRPMIEWIFGGVSALVVAGVIGFLAFEALFGDSAPPHLQASVEKLERVQDHTLVFITVANGGDRAAAGVAVEALVQRPGAEAERQEISFDYVAAHSVRRGAFVVKDQQIGDSNIVLTIHGYVEP